MALKEELIALTQEAFDSLPNYQTTNPTGTTIGKQWKREIYERGKPTGRFLLCEYTPHEKPGYVGISYKEIVIREAGLTKDQVVQMEDWHLGLESGFLKPKVSVGWK